MLYWTTPNNYQNPGLQEITIEVQSGVTNPSASPFPIFPDIATAQSYYMTAMCSALLTFINTLYGVTYYTGTNPQPSDPAVAAVVAAFAASKTNKAGFAAITALSASGIANVTGTAADNNPTNFTTLSGLLGIASGLNTANANQNAMADMVNAQETAINDLISYVGTLEAKINALIAAGQA